MEKNNITNTGLMFRGHSVLLGPSIFNRKADKLVLTNLDRYIKKHDPHLYKMITDTNGHDTLVDGAVPSD